MESLKTILFEFEKTLNKNQPPVLNILQEGLTIEMVENLLNQINFNTRELVTLYSWRNGISDFQNRVIEEMELFPRGIMLPLQEAIEHYRHALSQNLWERALFPIFTSGGGDYILFNSKKKNVLIYSPTILLSDKPVIIYESLELLFETIIECFRVGAYSFNKDGSFDIDYDLEENISKRKNPNSGYWNS